MDKNKNYSLGVWLLLGVILTSCVLSFSGCTSLKRKFVRKRQMEDKKELFIPVLEPIEYHAVEVTPKKTYTTHYVMMRAYYRDLLSMLGRLENDQRERYLITQISEKISLMARLLRKNESERLEKFSQQVQAFLIELDKAPSMRRYDVIKHQLRLIEQDIVKAFKPSVISQEMLMIEPE